MVAAFTRLKSIHVRLTGGRATGRAGTGRYRAPWHQRPFGHRRSRSSTNASRAWEPPYDLKGGGGDALNISLDSLDPPRSTTHRWQSLARVA